MNVEDGPILDPFPNPCTVHTLQEWRVCERWQGLKVSDAEGSAAKNDHLHGPRIKPTFGAEINLEIASEHRENCLPMFQLRVFQNPPDRGPIPKNQI